jgi:hypothetical protein
MYYRATPTIVPPNSALRQDIKTDTKRVKCCCMGIFIAININRLFKSVMPPF